MEQATLYQKYRGLSRRQFLQAAGGITLASLLVGCATPTTAPTTGNENTSPSAEGAQEINFLVRPDIRSAYGLDQTIETWNAENEQQVIVDEPVGAADTKIQAAMASGDLIWDGYAIIEGPWYIESWVMRGLIQPMDDLIAASTVPDADKVVPGIIPSVLEASKYEGQQYTIPGNVGSIALGWFWEPLELAGVEPPETWEDVRVAAEKIKEIAPEWTPFDSASTPLCDQMSMIWGGTNTPITEEGLIDWTGEVSIAALKWQQEMVADGLMPAVHTESFGNWLKGGTAIMTSYDVHGTMAQQALGIDKAATGINIRMEKGDPKAGTPFDLLGSVILQGAQNPQGMIDFLLWNFGPSNKVTGKQIATVAAKPAYQYTYDEFIAPDETQAWQLEGIELVRDSVPFPANLYWEMQARIPKPWIEKALDPANNLSAEEALESALAEMREEIAKMRS